jgi:hypothetical protein
LLGAACLLTGCTGLMFYFAGGERGRDFDFDSKADEDFKD